LAFVAVAIDFAAVRAAFLTGCSGLITFGVALDAD
jgi:hypothetical protein